jgi:hypothetical protein
MVINIYEPRKSHYFIAERFTDPTAIAAIAGNAEIPITRWPGGFDRAHAGNKFVSRE